MDGWSVWDWIFLRLQEHLQCCEKRQQTDKHCIKFWFTQSNTSRLWRTRRVIKNIRLDFLRFMILYLSTVDINFDTKAMYYVLCSMYYVQCTMYMMVPEMPALLSSQLHIHREQKQQSWNVFQLNQTKGIQWNAKCGEYERRNIFRFCDSRQCVEIILRDNHYRHRHHHHNYHHHIDNNVFFIIIIRDVRRFTAMCWLSPTLSLASHLPDCLGISYFVFQIVFTLFLSVLKFHIILYCLFFCKALSVFLHRRLDELPCRRFLAFHPLHRKVF